MSLAHPLVEATLHLYKDVLNAFLPTPGTCHYMFNLRDFAKVIQGIKLVPATHLRDPNKVGPILHQEVQFELSISTFCINKFIYDSI